VLDTQVYSNTGGQACTSGFLGQVSDMAAYGAGQHGKEEMRKELALIAMAHGRVFVLQSTQAAASHLIEGVLKGLQTRFPAVFGLHCPCPPEHGLGDDQATRASRLAMESRAYPILMYDPSAGEYISDQLSLDGNPSLDETWPSYEVKYLADNGEEKKLELPVTIADWAATETRFQKHFKKVKGDVDEESLVLFHEYMALPAEEREGKKPVIYQIDDEHKLTRLTVSHEIVELAQDRLRVWSHLKQMAGLELAPDVRDSIEYELEEEFNKKTEALQTEYSAKMAELKARYPAIVARRLAEGLVRAGNGGQTVADLMARVQEMPLAPVTAEMAGEADLTVPAPTGQAAPVASEAATAVAEAPAVAVVEEEEEEGLAMEPYIDSARCTTCDECTKLNNKMFAYNEKKQAYIKDPRAGTFKQLVQGAEKCPVRIIHPGTPLNPKEKDLEKWVKRAEPFN